MQEFYDLLRMGGGQKPPGQDAQCCIFQDLLLYLLDKLQNFKAFLEEFLLLVTKFGNILLHGLHINNNKIYIFNYIFFTNNEMYSRIKKRKEERSVFSNFELVSANTKLLIQIINKVFD